MQVPLNVSSPSLPPSLPPTLSLSSERINYFGISGAASGILYRIAVAAANGAFSALADTRRAAVAQHRFLRYPFPPPSSLPPPPPRPSIKRRRDGAGCATARKRGTTTTTTCETRRGKSDSPRRIRLPRLPSLLGCLPVSVSRRNIHDGGARGHNVHTGEKRVEGRAASFYATIPSE
jgi:hypothetical protein